MKWVKASERLPTEEGDYYVKYKTGEREVLYASGVGHHKRWAALVDQWLDESTPCNCERYREALEGLLEAIPKQDNDHDWWPDALTDAVQLASSAINK